MLVLAWMLVLPHPWRVRAFYLQEENGANPADYRLGA
jgi:hypothetical protein